MRASRVSWDILCVSLAMLACQSPTVTPRVERTPPVEPPASSAPGNPDAGSPEASASIQVQLDGLQPGWLVSTTRLTDQLPPDEKTRVSDGGAITLDGTDHDVFVSTVTDADGNLLSLHAMNARCDLASSKQLKVPAEFPTIQAAIDQAAPGDTVKVSPGTYTESLELRPGVCLLGSGAKKTILNANGATLNLIDLSHAPGSVVSGFTLRGVSSIAGCASSDVFMCSGEWYRAAIYLGGENWFNPTQDAPPLVINNVFENNEIAMMLYFRGVAVVRNNVFVDNVSAFVANHFNARTLIANNVFINNSELAIGNDAAYLDVIDNVIIGSAVGIRFEYIQTGHIECNIFYGNGQNQTTVYPPARFTMGEDGNVEADPQFVDAPGHDFHLAPGSPGIDRGCDPGEAFEPDHSAVDIGVFGGPLSRWIDL